MTNEHPRMVRERKTIDAMLCFYCKKQHQSVDNALCEDCAELRAYAMLRLEKCLYQQGKTTCAKCPIHCYKPEMRERIRDVMRYAGPRLTLWHPFLAIMHLLDGLRKMPVKPKK